MLRRRPNQTTTCKRRGWLAPLVAMALVVVMSAVALVLDRLWLDMAQGEAQAAADLAALAAARELANDESLRQPSASPEGRLALARQAALEVAASNRIAGQPCLLNPEGGDVTFGRLITPAATGIPTFVETSFEPTMARVIAQRTHVRENPVALFMKGLTGIPAGQVRALADATIDNHVAGFQTIGAAPVPMLPLAILQSDPSGQCRDTWQIQIEQRLGSDLYAYDPLSYAVRREADGIPEITLTRQASPGSSTESNFAWFNVHGQAGHFPLLQQIANGFQPADLARFEQQQLLITSPQRYAGRVSLTNDIVHALQAIQGQCRAVLLYQSATPGADPAAVELITSGAVAGRVMAIQQSTVGNWQIVFQPGVLATRTALCQTDLLPGAATLAATSAATVAPNPYIYQLKLTQ